MYLWTVGGSWSTWRNPTWTPGKHANSSQKGPRLGLEPITFSLKSVNCSTVLTARQFTLTTTFLRKNSWWNCKNAIRRGHLKKYHRICSLIYYCKMCRSSASPAPSLIFCFFTFTPPHTHTWYCFFLFTSFSLSHFFVPYIVFKPSKMLHPLIFVFPS